MRRVNLITQNDRPHEPTKRRFIAALHVFGADVDQLDALTSQEMQGLVQILHAMDFAFRLVIVPVRKRLAGHRLKQFDQQHATAQIGPHVLDQVRAGAGPLKHGIGPTAEGLQLNVVELGEPRCVRTLTGPDFARGLRRRVCKPSTMRAVHQMIGVGHGAKHRRYLCSWRRGRCDLRSATVFTFGLFPDEWISPDAVRLPFAVLTILCGVAQSYATLSKY